MEPRPERSFAIEPRGPPHTRRGMSPGTRPRHRAGSPTAAGTRPTPAAHIGAPLAHSGTHGLAPDVLVIGKSIGGGIPCGTFGFSQDLADRIARSVSLEDIDVGGIGGTLPGNGLSMAAMKAPSSRS